MFWCREHADIAQQPGVAQVHEGGMQQPVCEGEDGESERSDTDLESDGEGGEVLWGRSGVNAETYKRKMVVWKNEILGEGQRFPSADAFRYSIWKYATGHRFDYRLERNCRQRIVVTCKSRG